MISTFLDGIFVYYKINHRFVFNWWYSSDAIPPLYSTGIEYLPISEK